MRPAPPELRARQRNGGRARDVVGVVVDAGGDFPIESIAPMRFDRQAVHEVRQIAVARRKVRRRHRVRATAEIDVAAVHRRSGRITQIGIRSAVGVVVPHTERVTRAQGRREVVAQFRLGVILDRMDLRWWNPRISQSWLRGLRSGIAPVTGVPAAPGTPVLTSLLANDSGCPSLSRWLKLSHHAKLPERSPAEALACQPRKRSAEP